MPCQKLRFALVWLYKLSAGWIHIRGHLLVNVTGAPSRINYTQTRALTLLAAVFQ